MLTHFFRMLCDENTRLLDPTCGSGMAVKVAEASGASWALGLELNEEFAENARKNLEL
jgi:DNA modification methylase